MAACDECGQWPQPSLAVDAVVFNQDKVLLITRGKEPWKGMLAFPGGFVEKGEDPETAVIRELEEECGISGRVIDVVCVQGNPKRDPRGHVISIAYLVDASGEPTAGDDASNAAWYSVSSLPKLAGDHTDILNSALDRHM